MPKNSKANKSTKSVIATTAVYLRVSSVDQNPASQRAEISKWLKANNYQAANVVWFEDKETGKTLSRTAFEKMQKAIFAGEIKTLVVWKLDRLSRNQRDGINFLYDLCERGVRVVSVTEQLDFNGSFGRLMGGVFFAIAEMGLDTIRERQAVGIAAAKERGVYQQRCKGRPAGWTKGKPERARELLEQGFNKSEIARTMGVTRQTVHNYLAKAS